MMQQLLRIALEKKASDLHLSSGLPPMLRLDGELHQLDHPILEPTQLTQMMNTVMNIKQQEAYQTELEIDFSFQYESLARFRVNAYRQSGYPAAAIRTIPSTVPTIEALGLPRVLCEIASLSHGLVLVTGACGSGKSTTLAALVDAINTERRCHILTIEDPIEFMHPSKQCLVHQREIVQDTHCMNTALRSALRQDPDVILIGELRDADAIRLAITAAETGHLVLATLHARSAPQTIHRIVDAFSGEEKALIRSMLSSSLQAVIAQTLLKKAAGGRVAALEIMRTTPAIRNLIREDKIAHIYSTLQTSKSAGMQTLDQHILQLVEEHCISIETARKASLAI